MKILVCGGRNFIGYKTVAAVLDSYKLRYRDKLTIIHGGARGTDTFADRWAAINLVPTERYDAEWDRFGRAAGPIRNKRMLECGKPDLVIAFPGNKGTANMVSLATDAGIETLIIEGSNV